MSDFERASKQLDTCLVLADSVLREGKAGRLDAVYRQLAAFKVVFDQADIPPSLLRQLAAISDSCIDDPAHLASWTSAHAAAISLSQRVLFELYVYELPNWHTAGDAATLKRCCEKLAIDPALIPQLRSRIRRERAKVLKEELPPPKGKPGRKSKVEEDARIAKEYVDGLESGRWSGQAEYLRAKHAQRWKENRNAAKAWLSTLLKRADERETGKAVK